VNQTYDLVTRNSTVHLVQLDDGVPWSQALADAPFPAAVETAWADALRRAPTDQPLYLALAPLAMDRVSLTQASAGSSTPAAIAGAPFDAGAVVTAYTNYARRAVKRFHPAYLNLAVEGGELAQRDPQSWPAFASLITRVYTSLKRDNPALQIGVSFGLQSLMQPDVAQRVRPLIDALDYLGLSFYPYMSDFHERFGVAPLPQPPDEWRDAFAFLRTYTTKPIAMCETGYNSEPASEPVFNIFLQGSTALQAQYAHDLIAEARARGYLFVVWWVPIDLDQILDALPNGSTGRLWRTNGMVDSSLHEKPVMSVWRTEALQR